MLLILVTFSLLLVLFSLIVVILITMCLCVFLCELILYGALCASWTWVTKKSLPFPVREVFRYYLFKYFLGPFLFSPSGTIIVWILVCLMLSQRSLKLSSFLFILISFFSSASVISTTVLLAHGHIFLNHLIYYWFLLVHFHLRYCILHLYSVVLSIITLLKNSNIDLASIFSP